MSPMLDIQRRHAEVFRIRLGEKGPDGFPRKLTDSIRVTSPSRPVVEAFVEVYGGEVKPWSNGDEKQFEAYLPTTALSIMVLPGQSISQWWEFYKRTVCERRCDGVTEQLSGQPCVCPADLAVRMGSRDACKPMTRLNVICPDVEVVGAGSLVTHGMIAAETLPQSIRVAEAALERGLMVPAVLRVVEHKGKRHYIVPQVEIVGVSLTQLTTGEVTVPAVGAARPAELAPPAQAALPAAPVKKAAAVKKAPARKAAGPRIPSELPPLPGGPVGEGPAPRETVEEGTAAQTVPSETADEWDTAGVKARIDGLDAEHKALLKAAWTEAGWSPLASLPAGDVVGVTALIGRIEDQQAATRLRRQKHANAVMGEVGVKSDDARHELVSEATGGQTISTGALTEAQLSLVVDYCKHLADMDAGVAS